MQWQNGNSKITKLLSGKMEDGVRSEFAANVSGTPEALRIEAAAIDGFHRYDIVGSEKCAGPIARDSTTRHQQLPPAMRITVGSGPLPAGLAWAKCPL